MSVVFLIAALAGLALGPIVFGALHRAPASQLAVDGFVLVAIVGLVAFHVLPESFEAAGFLALFAASAGLLLPLSLERLKALSSRASHGIVLGVAFTGLMLHASIDGVGLGTADASLGLALAIVLHRFPVGLAVWWLVCPQFGRRWAVAVLAALGLATAGGFAVQTSLPVLDSMAVHLLQAFVAGSLLHVMLHQAVGFHDHTVEESRWRVPGAVGAIGGGALVAWLPESGAHQGHGHGHHSFGEHFFDVALVAAPLLVALFALGFAVLALRHRDEFGGRALRGLDTGAPWAVAAIVVGAIVAGEVSVEPGLANGTSLAVLAALTIMSLAHQGPRDFLTEVLPLDLLGHSHDHDHEHHHDHEHADHAHGLGHDHATQPGG